VSCCPNCGHEVPQLDLSDLAADQASKSRRGDPHAAQSAARLAFPKSGLQRRTLVECFATHPSGLTSEQAASATGMPPTSASTRCTELLAGGWLERLPEMRRTANGGSAHVFVITPAALEQLRADRQAAA
jgi:hypothetical protein